MRGGLGSVAKPPQPEPEQPGRVDPGRAAPVARNSPGRVRARNEAPRRQTDGGGTGEPEAVAGRAGAPRPGGARSPRAGRAARAERGRPMSRPRGARRRAGPRRGRARARSSQRRSTSAGVMDGSPAARRASPHRTFVMTSQSTGPPSVADRRGRPSRGAGCGAIRPGKPSRQCARRPQTGSNFGEASRPDSSGCTIHSSPSPSRSRCSTSHSWWAAIRGSSAGVADRDPPRPGEQGRLDRARSSPPGARRRCSRRAGCSDTGCSQKIVWPMNPSGPRACEQALELGARPRRVEPPPGDRGEARVPVPLPRVAARARTGVGEADAVAARPRPSSAPRMARTTAGELAAGQTAVRRIPRRAKAPSRASSPARRGAPARCRSRSRRRRSPAAPPRGPGSPG